MMMPTERADRKCKRNDDDDKKKRKLKWRRKLKGKCEICWNRGEKRGRSFFSMLIEIDSSASCVVCACACVPFPSYMSCQFRIARPGRRHSCRMDFRRFLKFHHPTIHIRARCCSRPSHICRDADAAPLPGTFNDTVQFHWQIDTLLLRLIFVVRSISQSTNRRQVDSTRQLEFITTRHCAHSKAAEEGAALRRHQPVAAHWE